MGFFNWLANLFSTSGRNDDLLKAGLEHARGGRPQRAIEVYNKLLESNTSNDIVKARALFNRALAYSSLDNDEQAAADLQEVMKLPNLPENVRDSARAQLARIKRRSKSVDGN